MRQAPGEALLGWDGGRVSQLICQNSSAERPGAESPSCSGLVGAAASLLAAGEDCLVAQGALH